MGCPRGPRATGPERGGEPKGRASTAGELEAIEAGHLDPGYSGLLHIPEALGITSTALLLRIEEFDAAPESEA